MASFRIRRARLALISFTLLIPAAGSAQTPAYDSEGYYLRLDTGYGFARDAKAGGAPVTGRVNEVEGSPVVAAGAGYRFSRYFRADVTTGYAGSYELNDRDSAGNGWKADIEAWSTFLNLYAEYPLGEWSPYLTAGAGVSRNKTGTLTRSPTALTIPGKTTTEFAWQAGAGVGYALSPNWSLDLGYRYVDAGQFKTGDTASDGTSGNTVNGDLRSHVAMLGIRYSFGAPPAPAAAPSPTPAAAIVPPAPPPAPTGRNVPDLPVLYRIYFEWDKADITADSARTLQEAASTAKAAPVTRIVATGHADRSGTERYNMALSLRRASAVKALLVRDGVPENQIVVLGRGERENLVPTADGAREMLNRRVEIVLE